jgi:splicing factor 3B subunit 2
MQRKLGAGVEVTLDPNELENLDEASLKKKYDTAHSGTKREDFSDMVAEHMTKQTAKKKQKKDDGGSSSSSSKKYKEFKF